MNDKSILTFEYRYISTIGYWLLVSLTMWHSLDSHVFNFFLLRGKG